MKFQFHQILLYEIGSRLFCKENACYLDSIPKILEKEEIWNSINAIWCMGVWEHSPVSQKIASNHPGLLSEYEEINPKFTNQSIYGSPYAIYQYEPDPLVGSEANLHQLQEGLHSLGKTLILDFVPNHMALDAPIIKKYPNLFLEANSDLDKDSFLHSNGKQYRHGKDPFFPGWTDTIQWDFSNSDVMDIHIEFLHSITKFSDGVRCDMAMLPLPDVFQNTHGKESRYNWSKVIKTIKTINPHFQFYAEVYWGREAELLDLGFDAVYRKDIYDVMERRNYQKLRSLLENNSNARSIFFLENHDEERAFTKFGKISFQYFAILCFLDGILLFHREQELGFSKKIPVQLVERERETPDLEYKIFYQRAFDKLAKRDKFPKYLYCNFESYSENLPWNRSIQSENQIEILIWNENKHPLSGWVELPKEIENPKSVFNLIDGKIYDQDPKNEKLFYSLAPGEVQWLIF